MAESWFYGMYRELMVMYLEFVYRVLLSSYNTLAVFLALVYGAGCQIYHHNSLINTPGLCYYCICAGNLSKCQMH